MANIIEYFYTVNIGNYRKINQDNFFCDGDMLNSENSGTDGICSGKVSCDENPVFCVFDGMGGEQHGEIAAYIAAKEMKNHTFSCSAEDSLRDYCNKANISICKKTKELEISSMGTTAAILRFTKNTNCLCNIGDSKIFLFSNGSLSQLSYDHIGIAVFGKKPPLTQNLGIPEDELKIDPYIASGDYHNGDIYLICSDGLTDMVNTNRIKEIIKKNPGFNAAELLLEEALKNGGKDNITFILMYVAEKPKKRFLEKVKLWLKKN